LNELAGVAEGNYERIDGGALETLPMRVTKPA